MWWKNFASNAGNTGGEILPDRISTEPLTGFRSWLVGYDKDGIGLKSIVHSHIWSNPETATCLNLYEHTSPDPECSCGLYCQTPDQPLLEWEALRRGKVSATGTVALSGRVIICEKGYKAQHAEIISSVILDVSCWLKECVADAKYVQHRRAETDGHKMVAGFLLGACGEHVETREGVLVKDSKHWLGEACNGLAERYPTIEFLTWQ